MIATLVFMASTFIPSYQYLVGEGDSLVGYHAFPFVAFQHQKENLIIPCFVFFFGYLALLLLAGIFYVVSYSTKEDAAGDKEDKFFVFGSFIGAIASAFFALMCIGISSFIPMLLGLFYAIAYIVAIVIHHKYLTDY